MRLRHGRIGLELHQLGEGRGPALLALHELYGSSRDWDVGAMGWPGPVYALDFCGHGESDRLRGGAYLCEMLLGDADAALARIGSASLVGRGLGAWIATILSGARRDEVAAALLLAGRGVGGGGAVPSFAAGSFAAYLTAAEAVPTHVDGRVHVLEKDVRPVEYALRFACGARQLLLCEDGGERPAWWEAVRGVEGAAQVSEEEAFERLRAASVGEGL